MSSKIFVIAEAGINHNGDLEIVKKMIDIAKFAGCDAVKFQKRDILKVYTQEYLDSYRESPFGSTNKELKSAIELNKEQYDFIDTYCKEKNIFWFASPWDIKSFNFLKSYNCPQQKLASALINHEELVNLIAQEGKHTFISTGMSTLDEIDKVVNTFRKYRCSFTLLHCCSTYPMNNREANLLMIPELKKRYNVEVGYSGHSAGIIDAVLAVALGATVIEKHITLDRSMYGSDQSASLEPQGLYKMVEYIRAAEQMLGSNIKTISKGEQEVRAKLMRTKDYV